MPVPVDVAQVVVEMAPPESPAELKAALLDACSRAAQGASCVEAVADHAAFPGVVAIVSWKDAAHVRLEVAIRREQEWVAREIAFDEHDVPEERWRAVGLMIGTLGSGMGQSDPPPPSEPKVAPPPAVPVPERQTSAAPAPMQDVSASAPARRGWLHVAAIAGSSYRHALPRLGGEFGGAVRLSRSGLHATAAVAYAAGTSRPLDVRATWAEASLGVSLLAPVGSGSIGSAALTVGVHADGFCERFVPRLNPSAAPSGTGEGPQAPVTGERWLGGARLGAEVMWWGLEPVALLLGGALRWTAGETEVRAGGESAGTTPPLGYSVRAGVAYGFR